MRALRLPVAAITDRFSGNFSFGTAFRPVKGEMPAVLKKPLMLSGVKAACHAGFIMTSISECTITLEALRESEKAFFDTFFESTKIAKI